MSRVQIPFTNNDNHPQDIIKKTGLPHLWNLLRMSQRVHANDLCLFIFYFLFFWVASLMLLGLCLECNVIHSCILHCLDVQSYPRVLLTHIPLYRRDSTYCGPNRKSPVINQVLISLFCFLVGLSLYCNIFPWYFISYYIC